MIRINLMPGARRATKVSAGGNQPWIIAYVAVSVLTVAILAVIYASQSGVRSEKQAANNQLQRDIEELEEESSDIESVRAQLESSRQLEEVVADLQRARYGPTQVLRELSTILSPGQEIVDPARLEELRRENPLATINPAWMPRRLWLTEFSEEDRECTIRGAAVSGEDVAEFMRRLRLSPRFAQVRPIETEGVEDPVTHLAVTGFALTCQVVY